MLYSRKVTADLETRLGPESSLETERKAWVKAVTQNYRERCGNCGGAENLRARLIVPEENGGRLVEANGVLLCRACDIASEPRAKKSGDQRLVNFWVSRKLFDSIKLSVDGNPLFASMGALVRCLMSRYTEDPSRYEDLELFQDDDLSMDPKTKINVWVDRGEYAAFKEALDTRGMTVTDALKSLIVAYQMEVEPMIAQERSDV